MKTKREVLEEFVKNGDCHHLQCLECPYYEDGCPKHHKGLYMRLAKIGAMTILRMFKEKKKPILDIGTKIKFPDKKIAVVDTYNGRDHFLMIEGSKISLDYLIGRTWEIVE